VNAERRKTLLISDLHLDPAAPQIARQFIDFLRGEARTARALYILGDLFEAWLGDDDPDPAVRTIVAELRALREAGVPTYFMHGNRDFLIGSRFAAETGCTLLDDGSLVDLHGEQVLLMHGDVLCTADTSYQRLRHILRNPLTLFVLRNLGLESRRRLGRKLRAGSQMHVGATAPDIMDVTPAAVVEALRSAGVRTLVHGHTHRPAIHTLDVDGKPARRIVLGDWHAQGSVLEWSDGGVELSTLPR
jgi:UDP-2,3-diacylglucosamine hydrolase